MNSLAKAVQRAALTVLLALVAGCGGGQDVVESVKQTASQVQQTVTSTVDTAQTKTKEQLNLVGSSELTLDVPLKTPSCYATFTPATAGRSSVLTLQSYRTADKESFPSFYVHAAVSAASLTELPGQTVPAQMFVKPAADAASWYTTPEQPVQLKIVSIENQQVVAEVASGALQRTDGQASMNAAGKFVAVLP
jgi:hypothetical protein